MTKQDIIDYIMTTPENTNPVILGQMLDSIEGSSGGSSNFSTATVTFVNSASDSSYIVQSVPIILDGVVLTVTSIPVNESATVTIPLYKGQSFIELGSENPDGVDYGVMPTFTGGVSYTDGGLLISGDGTATFAGTLPPQ